MLKRILIAAMCCVPVKAVWALDVATIVACKPEGRIWLCAAFENEKVQVFRSENYISKVEFKGAALVPQATRSMSSKSMSSKSMSSKSMSSESMSSKAPPPAMMTTDMHSGTGVEDSLPNGNYTLQLLACNAAPCRGRMQKLEAIPDAQVVEIRNQGKLWEVLIVGGHETRKSAQQAAGSLIKRYRLRDKPWVRTVESIRTRLVNG